MLQTGHRGVEQERVDGDLKCGVMSARCHCVMKVSRQRKANKMLVGNLRPSRDLSTMKDDALSFQNEPGNTTPYMSFFRLGPAIFICIVPVKMILDTCTVLY